jgi:hypothetical protein
MKTIVVAEPREATSQDVQSIYNFVMSIPGLRNKKSEEIKDSVIAHFKGGELTEDQLTGIVYEEYPSYIKTDTETDTAFQ